MESTNKAFDESIDKKIDNFIKDDVKLSDIDNKSYGEKLLARKEKIKSEELASNEPESFNELNEAMNNSYIQNTEKTQENNDYDELNHDTGSEYRQNESKNKEKKSYDELTSDTTTVAAIGKTRTSAGFKGAKQAWANLLEYFS